MKSREQLSKQEEIVRPLLEYLASGVHQADGQWEAWQITRIVGGFNNLLYRATGSWGDLAIKFSIRDKRDRASREYSALLALHQAGLSIAPKPILLDRTSYTQPVVVQSWLEGEVVATPPDTDAEWASLLQHFATIHTLTPDKTNVKLRKAVLNANSVRAGRRLVWQQLACIPRQAQPVSLQELIREFQMSRFSEWSDTSTTLCRVDANCLNLIRRPGLWASVDWENSGWGDPAFEIADLMTHPAYMTVPPSRWDWVIDTYGSLVGDATVGIRIQVYYEIMLVWWAARLARYLYEVPRRLDERLVARPVDWQADIQAKYEHYIDLATPLYSQYSAA